MIKQYSKCRKDKKMTQEKLAKLFLKNSYFNLIKNYIAAVPPAAPFYASFSLGTSFSSMAISIAAAIRTSISREGL